VVQPLVYIDEFESPEAALPAGGIARMHNEDRKAGVPCAGGAHF